jgi:hypothetical protein
MFIDPGCLQFLAPQGATGTALCSAPTELGLICN